MAKETIATIKAAELSANQISLDAKTQALEIVDAAEKESKKSFEIFKKQMAEKSEALQKKAISDAQKLSQDILLDATKKAQTLDSVYDEKSEEISKVLLTVITE